MSNIWSPFGYFYFRPVILITTCCCMTIPQQLALNLGDIAQEKSQANIEQKRQDCAELTKYALPLKIS